MVLVAFTSPPRCTRSLTVVSPRHERPRYGGPVGAPVCDLSRGVPPEPPPKRSFPEGAGKRIVSQQSDSVVWRDKSSLKSPTVVLPDPFSTTPYSLTHRLFPFRDYGCCFRVPRCRSHRSRGTCGERTPLRRDAIRRTSFGRHSPSSTTGLSVAVDLFSLEISSFHRRSCRRRRRPLLTRRRRRRASSPALVPSPPPVVVGSAVPQSFSNSPSDMQSDSSDSASDSLSAEIGSPPFAAAVAPPVSSSGGRFSTGSNCMSVSRKPRDPLTNCEDCELPSSVIAPAPAVAPSTAGSKSCSNLRPTAPLS